MSDFEAGRRVCYTEKDENVEYISKRMRGKLLECVCLVRKSGMSVKSAKSDEGCTRRNFNQCVRDTKNRSSSWSS